MIKETKVEETGMPRFAKEKYPLGTYKYQRAEGIPIHPDIAGLLSIYAEAILEDMQFIGLIAGGLGGVRMGKSTLAQNLGEYYTEEVNKNLKEKGINEVDFGINNIVFKIEELHERAEQLPKYSCLILDEGDDLTVHHASAKMRELKSFFQKSGQLNLFIILILPNFFDFPKNLARDRSNFLAVVKFNHDHTKRKFFQRGFYDYFNSKDKNKLYQMGAKYNDLDAVKPTYKNCYFHGDYLVDEKEYREMKSKDFEKYSEDNKNPTEERDIKLETLRPIIDKMKKDGKKMTEISECTGIPRRTLYDWGFHKELLSSEQVSININNNSRNEKNNDDLPLGLEGFNETSN